MRRSFWKAAWISAGAYVGALLAGFGIDFRLTLFAVLGLQGTWTAYCVIRLFQLRLAGGHKPEAPLDERESYGFALGGAISSAVLLAAMVVLSQAG